jgi:hypothetical protein
MHKRSSPERIISVARQFEFDTSREILSQASEVLATGRKLIPGTDSWEENSPEFQEFRDAVVTMHLTPLLLSLNERMTSSCHGIRYIEPLRATADRYYRFQDLAVDEIDSQGQNLPMFVDALPQDKLIEFQEWTERHFGFSVRPERHEGHVSILVTEANFGTHNLADTGFGYSQILPIATQLWWQTKLRMTASTRQQRLNNDRGLLAIEQPELHLHPRLQAQVADAFAAAIRYSQEQHTVFRIVAETHSEAIVNRLGELVASGKLSSKDVNLVIFERDSPDSPSKVRCVEYDEKGYLKDWPYGFFNAGGGRV